MALYSEKYKEKNNFAFFNSNIRDTALQKIQTQESIRKSIEHGDFVLYYQPQWDITARQKWEWKYWFAGTIPRRSLISPSGFIPIAEDVGKLFRWVSGFLLEACQKYQQMRNAGLPPILMSVNLSAKQFKQADLLQTICSIFKRTGMPPEYLILEITESPQCRIWITRLRYRMSYTGVAA